MKQNTFSASLVGIGSYKLVQIGEGVVASIYNYKLIATNNEGHGIFHDMVGNGIGMGPVEDPFADDVLHYIEYEDAEGGKIFMHLKGTYTGPSAGEGTFMILGGAGRYENIEGEGRYTFEGLNYNYHDPQNPNHEGPVQSRAGIKGVYRLP